MRREAERTDLEHLHADSIFGLWSIERNAINPLDVGDFVEVRLGRLDGHFWGRGARGRRFLFWEGVDSGYRKTGQTGTQDGERRILEKMRVEKKKSMAAPEPSFK